MYIILFSLQRPSAPAICIMIATSSVIIFCLIAEMIHNMVLTHTVHDFKLYCYFCQAQKCMHFSFLEKIRSNFTTATPLCALTLYFVQHLSKCINICLPSSATLLYQCLFLPPVPHSLHPSLPSHQL